MITIKKNATQHFFSHKRKKQLLCLNLKKKGCSGYFYELKWKNEKEINIENHEQLELLDINNKNKKILFIFPKKDLDKLEGLVIDYEQHGLSKIVTFSNPNVKNKCGCGISVSFEEK